MYRRGDKNVRIVYSRTEIEQLLLSEGESKNKIILVDNIYQ